MRHLQVEARSSGDIELLKYSTFALPDYESETGHVLLCRTHAYSDIEVELLNFDEDLLSPLDRGEGICGRVAKVSALTHDIRLLEIEHRPADEVLGRPICRPDASATAAITRSFSMANAPSEGTQPALHHQEIPRRSVFRPARWRT